MAERRAPLSHVLLPVCKELPPCACKSHHQNEMTTIKQKKYIYIYKRRWQSALWCCQRGEWGEKREAKGHRCTPGTVRAAGWLLWGRWWVMAEPSSGHQHPSASSGPLCQPQALLLRTAQHCSSPQPSQGQLFACGPAESRAFVTGSAEDSAAGQANALMGLALSLYPACMPRAEPSLSQPGRQSIPQAGTKK